LDGNQKRVAIQRVILMTREEMIDQLIKDVETWDLESLIDSVQYYLEVELGNMSDAEITHEWEQISSLQ
jgi:hypothetical protein